MSGGIKERSRGAAVSSTTRSSGAAHDLPQPGKRPLTEQLTGEPVQRKAGAGGGRDRSFDRYEDRSFHRYEDRAFEPASVQRKAASSTPDPGDQVHAAAEHGISGISSPLPHASEIQRSFGRHDVSGIKAHTGGAAAAGAAAMGAQAFASGTHVAFAGTPDLHTAAHEAAHVVQQRGGLQLKGGVGEVGDPYEQHADAVADAVVAGRSAEPLLDPHAGGSGSAGSNAAVQRAPATHTPHAARHEPDPHIASATPGIDKAGFIDNGSGAPLYNRPPEAGGELVRAAPLPPTARVFVSGTYPKLSDWWYVTAYLEQTMVRGYVERVRVAADLPEPLAELRQLTGGETAEGLAKEKYHEAVRDGHDLRYYENVLLYVNQQHHRKGVIGAYQDPGVAGNGSNNVQLVAGHRIWLVSPAYAKALESVVPSGSLTGGAVAKVKRFVGHLQDILHSVTESRHYLDEVAGEYAQSLRDHLPEIVGITAGFLMAEATSMFLAAAPTGVSQAAAAVIQLALAAFGAAGMVQAGIEALKHGSTWLTTAWTAQGNPEKIAAASKEFLRMLVAIAMAALAHLGAKGNYRNALKIASNMPTGGLPALATAGSEGIADTSAATGVAIGPSTGAIGAAGAQMTKHDSEGGGPEPTQAPSVEKPPTRAEAQAEFATKHAKNIANEAAGVAEVARKPMDLGNEWARVQAEGERLYRDTFCEEYVKARAAGETDFDAIRTARDIAKKATKAHVRAEGVKLAEARARADVLKDANGDGVPDAFKRADGTVIQDFANFRSGARGALAKQFATELPGKTVEEMEVLLQKSGGTRDPATPGTFKPVLEGENTYQQACYTYPDGTLVRIKPFGDIKNRAKPMYSVEMQTKSLTGGRPQDDVAFKLDPSGSPVPKGKPDINNPYTPQQPIQRKAYQDEILRLGHRLAKEKD